MKHILRLISSIFALGVLLTGCVNTGNSSSSFASGKAEQTESTTLSESRTQELYALAETFTQYTNAGEIDKAINMMDETMKKAMDGKLEGIWEKLTKSLGPYGKMGSHIGVQSGEYEVLEVTLEFEKGTQIQRTVFDSDGNIAGLFFKNGAVTTTTEAEGVSEFSVTVDSGEGYPLEGILTLPSAGKPTAAVVLLHGSGPSDKNETVGLNHPFQDLAQGLAKEGIAVLRYDKRTYMYGQAMAAKADFPQLTIEQEVVTDAVAAVKLLQSDSRVEGAPVYLLGHSMSGGLLSYIAQQGADCAGYVVMAGTPRNMWELSAEQNLLIAEEMEQGGDGAKAKEIRTYVETESKRAEALKTMTDEEALSSQPIFGMPAWYLRKFEEVNSIALHLQDKKPVLVLQGEKDRQVTMKDLGLWQEGLKDHPSVQFQTYPKLNHIFGDYQGDAVPFSQLVTVEYAQATPVAEQVTQDIATWIGKQNHK